ncbi:methionine--tRNA ligase [Candidatus Gracilibacteria bacterium]|nr:methionine--tRNA ligase [Candidatus Gracilibacteria bacterium]MCF7856253.1 methionine--tRNA ligase [Candidatus Gracilibacteria bacterium]MCF7896268.1 methionine--tRNA ligase [Candidatus Gracilibacteria bacterium]
MKNFYITTAIPYVNAAPHIGFAMEAIQADAIARFKKQRGFEVRFQTGTDEHGVKIQKLADELGKNPKEIVDANAKKFENLREALDLTFDDFIQTSDQKKHWGGAQKMWQKLVAAGKLEKRKYKGMYCAGCEEFKSEKDLTEGRCPNHPNLKLEEVEEENWFFRLSDYSAQIQKLLESREVEILPHFRAKEFLNVVKEGLHDVSFSRSSETLKWGIPVPDDSTQTMYVWCDALTNYISALDYGSTALTTSENESAEFKKWWLDSEKVHVIGKDIVRFHAGIWLGMLLAAELPLPDKIYIHGFITSEGQKMSKSSGNVVDPIEFSQEWGSDALRYYLLSEIPNGKDGDFSKARFEEIYNSALANGLGNLVSRVVAMTLKIKNAKFKMQNSEKIGEREVAKMWEKIESAMSSGFDFRSVLAAISVLVEFANKFVTEKKPWELKDSEKVETLSALLEILRQISIALTPFLPTTAERIASSLGVSLEGDFEKLKKWGSAKEFKLSKTGILFPKR